MELVKLMCDEKTIKSLERRGFFVVAKEKINGSNLFSFVKTDALVKLLSEKYSATKFIYDNRLRFDAGGS